MAAVVRRTPNGSGIAGVYTPPGHRRRAFCFLHTDLANPTSNATFQRIGDRPVCDMVELVFAAPAA
jgi:uncharacterized protein